MESANSWGDVICDHAKGPGGIEMKGAAVRAAIRKNRIDDLDEALKRLKTKINLEQNKRDQLTALPNPIQKTNCRGTTRYGNPWSSWRHFHSREKVSALIRWKFDSCCTRSSDGILPNEDKLTRDLPILPKEEILKNIETVPGNDQVRATWLGHASVLLQFEGANILCDPVFSETVGPTKSLLKRLAFKRYRSAPLQVQDLPQIDAVVISHDHHDHLDEASIREMILKFPNIKWFLPKGLKEWMEKTIAKTVNEAPHGESVLHYADRVVELGWWEKSTFVVPNQDKQLVFTFTPSQHWGGRSPCSMNTVLWGSWVISLENLNVWFGGDTGYCKVFKQIGELFGRIDLAAIPIGAYLPRDVMKDQHVEPTESIMIHKDLKARQSIAIHWGTFNTGASEGYMDPKNDLKKGLRDAGVYPEDFVTLDHGESITVDAPNVSEQDDLNFRDSDVQDLDMSSVSTMTIPNSRRTSVDASAGTSISIYFLAPSSNCSIRSAI